MNRPIVMAQLGGASPTQAQSVRVIKLAKPGDSQAQTVYLGYEQKFKIDLSGIANEKLTFVHIGEKLIILFDNQSTLTIDPFFDAAGAPRNNIAFDVNGREIDGSQFASTFPITTDQSVLPAAGDGAGGAPASGGSFRDAAVDPFASSGPLDLLGQEELGNLEFAETDSPPPDDILPEGGASGLLLVDDEDLSTGTSPNAPVTDTTVLEFVAGSRALVSFAFGPTNQLLGLDWAANADGTELIGSDERGAVVRLTLVGPGTINAGGIGEVSVTVELLQNFDTHPIINSDDQIFLGSVTVVATDTGGNSVTGTVRVFVSDDVPELAGGEARVSGAVEEDGMASIGLNPDQSDGNKDFTDDDTQDEASGAAGSLGALFKSGADSPLTFGLLAGVDGLPTLFSKGEQVTYEVVGNTLTASAGGRDVFTLTVNADGSWAFDLKDQLDHVDNGLNDENLQLRTSADGSTGVGAIDFSSIIVATDSDGDSVSGLAAGSFTIAVEDDIPEQVPPYQEGEEGGYRPPIVGYVEEDGMSRTATESFPADLSEGNKGAGDSNADDETGMGQPSLQTLFSAGADEPLTFSLAENPGELLPTLFSKGVQLEYTTENGVLTATADGRTVFVLTVNADGTWTFDLQDQLDHVDDNANTENTMLRTSADGSTSVGSIDFSRIIVATDFDGDSVDGLTEGSFTIVVEDDVPVIPGGEGAEPVRIDEDNLNGPLSVGNNDQASGDDGAPNQLPAIEGTLPFSIGSDEPADVTFVEMHGDQVVGTFSDDSSIQVESKDRPLYYFWDQSTHSLYATWATPADFGTGDPANNAAFKIEITDTDTGAYTFTLLDQLDHLPNFAGEQEPSSQPAGEQPPVVAFEDNIRLDLTYTVTDSDGDEATGTISFDVDDDIPVLADVAPAARYVDEDDIATWNPNSSNNQGSKGNDPNDGPGDGVNDGSETGNPPSNNTGPAFIQGTIANQVSVGADEPPKFTFLDLAGVRQKLEALGLMSQGVELDYDVITGANSNVLVGYDDDTGSNRYQSGDRLVFKLTLNNDGTYTFELFDQLDHDAPFDDASDVAGPGDTDPTSDQNTDLEDSDPSADVNSIDFGQVIKATDFDGDSVALDGRLTIVIRDDIPEARDGEVVRGVVEEEHLSGGNEDFDADPDLDQDHSQFGNDFNDTTTVISGSGGDSLASLIDVGADEPGKFTFKSGLTSTNVKDLDGNNVTSNGVQVKITSITSGDDSGGDYQLLTATAGGNPVFTLKVYEDGDWRFELKDQIDHHPINDADDIEDYLALNFSGLIKFTDFDGDTIGLDAGSFYVKVIDDIPEAEIRLTGRSVIHDESAGHDDSNDNDTDSNAVKAIFNNVPTPRGDDPDVASNPIGYAQNPQAIVASTSSVGADRPGSQVFSLSVVQGVDSGLRTTEGAVIKLYAESSGGVDYIVGRVGDQTGLAAFAIHINSSNGVVSVVQYLSLQHDDINDHEESNDNGENSGDDQDLNQFPNPDQQDLAGKIRAVVTVTDQDGDQDTASVDIGENIKFQDDGPKVRVEANDHKEADDIKVTLDETNPGGSPDDNNGFTDVVQPSTNPANLKPIGQVSTPSNATSSVAVSDLFDVSITEGADGVAPANVVTTYSLKLTDKNNNSDIGKYVETTLRVTNLDGTPYEGASADARTIWLVRQADGTILGVIGRNSSGGNSGADGAVGDYIALKIELTGSATDPQFKVTQYLPIEHPTSGASHDEGISLNLVGSNSSLEIVLNVKATDGDGDYDDDTHAIEVIDHDDSIIRIEDDGPTIVAGQTITTAVYEDGLATGNTDAGRPGEVAPSGAASFTAAAGTLNALVDFGTDGPHPTQAFSLKSVSSPVDSNLNSRGGDVLIVSDGSILRGYVNSGGGSGFGAGDRLVFTLTVNGDGSYTFTLLDQIDHPDTIGGDNSENSLTTPIDLSSYIIARDGDGDTVSLGAGAFVVTIQDDMPIQLAGNTATGTVEEEHGLPGANEDIDDANNLDNDLGNNPNVVTNESTGTLGALVKTGADETGTFGIAPNPTGLPQLTSLDQPIVYHVSGNTLTAYVNTSGGGFDANDRQIFTLEITNTSTGAYKFTLLDNIDHHSDAQADSVEGILALNLSSAITFTDRDGDTIVLSGGQNGNQGLIVTVIDDVPVLDGKICLTSGTGVAQYGANPADMLYAIPAGTGLTIDVTNLEDDAGHNNSLGYVFLDAAGQPISGVVIEDGVDDGDADRTITIPAGSVPAGAVMLGFFILPDGNDLNNIADGDAVTFQNIAGDWVAFHNGNPLSTADGDVLFSDRRLNPDISPDGNLTPGDDFDQNTSSGTTSNAHWEDTVGGIIFNGSDKDFDDVEFTVTVCATASNIVVLVDEHGLNVHGIDNNRPGEEPGNGLATITSAAAALAALVDFGADGPHATNPFSLAPTLSPQAIAYSSKGGPILVLVNGNTLTGYVEEGAVDREVFTLTIQPDGTYTFTLKDQIDHPALDGQSPGDNSENLLASAIDLSAFIVAMDGDGDKLTLPAGTFKVQVLDDIPVANAAAYVTGDVDEDDLKQITPENDNSTGIPAEGSGGPDAPTDKHTFTAASLASLIATVGADEPGSLIFNGNVNGAVQKVGGGAVESHGDPVLFGTSGSSIVGYVDVNGTPGYQAADRLVFTMALQPNGDIEFDLKDQIDHPFASGESAKVEINLSPALLILDFDGDTVPVAADKFTIKVENDIPGNTAENVTKGVAEDHLSQTAAPPVPADNTTGILTGAAYPSDEVEITATELRTLFVSGADEEIQFELDQNIAGLLENISGSGIPVTSHGEFVAVAYVNGQIVGFAQPGMPDYVYNGNERIVFTLTPSANGFVFDLRDQLDHNPPASTGTVGDSEIITLDLSAFIIARDFDGDIANLGQDSLRIIVENDVPTAVINPLAETLTVDETFLGGAGAADSASAASFFSVNYGADGPGSLHSFSLSLTGSGPTGLADTLTGKPVTLVQVGAAVHGVIDAGLGSQTSVFTLALDGSNNVVLTQLRAIVHDQVGSNPLTDHDDPEFLSSTGLIKLNATVTDFDLDSVPVSVSLDALLRFEDDGPTLAVTAKEGALTSLGTDTEVDETTNDLDNSDADDDRYNTAEVEDAGGNPNNDDGAGFLGRVTTNVAGGIHNLFNVTGDSGADGLGALTNGLVSFGGLPTPPVGLATNLEATDGGAITLFSAGATKLVGKDTQGHTVFEIEIVGPANNLQIQTTLFEAIEHTDANLHDNEVFLKLAQDGAIKLLAQFTRTDKEGDSITVTGEINLINDDANSIFSFDDDGPKIISVVPDVVVLGSELIQNGGFENGHGVAQENFGTFYSITGWNAADRLAPGTADDIPFEIQQGTIGDLPAHTGSSKVELDSDTQPPNQTGLTNSTIQQTIATAAGEEYQLSFWFSSRPNTLGTSGMDVFFDGQLVLSIPPNNAFTTWTQFTVTATAIDSSSVLSFTSTGQGEELGAYLDDVSLRHIISSTASDDEDTNLLGVGIQGGPGDDGAGVVSTGKINFDAGEDKLGSIQATGAVTAIGQFGALPLEAIYVGLDGKGIAVPLTAGAWVPDGSGGGSMVWGHPSIPLALRLTIDADGDYKLEQFAPLRHPSVDNPATAGAEIEFEDNLQLNFTFKVTDKDGDSVDGTISVNVDDDTPDLVSIEDADVDNAASVVAGDIVFVSGADGIGQSTLFGNTPPAGLTVDGQAVHYWVSTDGGTLIAYTGAVVPNGAIPPAGPSQVFTLTLNPNGLGYTFQLQQPFDGAVTQTVTDLSFNVKLTDGDGDAEAGTIDVTVTDHIPTVTVPGVGAPGTVVDEKGLPDGSGELADAIAANDTSEATSGSFSYTPGDGATTITIGGVLFTGAPQTFNGDYGTLQVTSVVGTTINYTYTLGDNTLDHDNTTADATPGDRGTQDQVFDVFAITVTDAGGDVAATNLTVAVNDDGPVAVDDTDSVSTAPTQVLSFDDIVLPDGAEQPMPVGYGGFSWGQAGVYNPGLPAYAPHSGPNLAFAAEANGIEFGYPGAAGSPLTISRGTDFTPVGGWFSAVPTSGLPITFEAFDDGALRGTYTVFVNQGGPTYIDFTAFSGFTSIDELRIDAINYFGLDDFSYRNDAAVATGNVVTGVDGAPGDANTSPLDGSADTLGADGFGSIAWNGAITVLGATTVAGLFGTLTVDALGNYSYKLDDANPAVVGWTTGDAPLLETFNYTITDGDGDTDTAALTINVTGSDDGVGLFDLTLAINGGEAILNEDDLGDGSSPNPAALTQNGTFSFSAPDGIDDLIVGGVSVVTNGAVTLPLTPIAMAHGELTINDVNLITGQVSYSYTLTNNTLAHGPANNGANSVADSIAIVVTDLDGSSDSDLLDILVIDDVPTATAEASQDVAEGATTAIGQLDFVQGADGATVTHIDGNPLTFAGDGWATVNVALGTLKVKADGQYQFTAANPTNSPVPPVVFNYTVTDADGDTSQSTLTFQITDANTPVSGTAAAAVDDDGLAGNNPASNLNDLNANLGDTAGDTSEATFTGMLGGSVGGDIPGVFSLAGNTSGTVGTENVSYTWAGNVLTATGPRGPLFKVEITNPSTGAYKVTLLDNVLHAVGPDGENATDPTTSLAYTITDSDGTTAPGTLTITFDDDAPTARADTDDVGTGTIATGNLITDNAPGDLTDADVNAADSVGADGAAITHIQSNNPGGSALTAVGTSVTINGQYGSLSIEPGGDYTYTRFASAFGAGTDTFTYTLTDGDGDQSTQTLTITLADTGVLVVGSNESDDGAAPDPLHTVQGASPNGEVNGAGGNDILIGDPGGTTLTAGSTANIVFVLDTSDSMTDDNRLAEMKAAVADALTDLRNSGAQDVRVHIVRFGSEGETIGTFDLISGGVPSGTGAGSPLANAITAVNNLGVTGNTNYEAGLQLAQQWIEGATTLTNTDVTSVLSTPAIGSDAVQVLGNGSTQLALVSGWNAPGTVLSELQDATGSISGGWGTGDNNIVASGELIRFDFGSFNDFNVAGYGNPGSFSGQNVTRASFTLDNTDNGLFSSSTFNYTIHFTDGAVESGSEAVGWFLAGLSEDVELFGTGGNAGKQISYIEFVMGAGDQGRVDLQSITSPQTVPPGTLPGADLNTVLFVSDGAPNRALDIDGDSFDPGDSQDAIDQVLGSDGTNEVGRIEQDNDAGGLDQVFTIHAVGIDLSGSPFTLLGQVEGMPNNGATNVTSAEQLTSVIGTLSQGQSVTTAAGSDIINGAAGADIILGDVPFTDTLATTLGVSVPAASGWAVFQTLESRANNESADPAGNGADWTRADTIAYIAANHLALSAESGRTGGNDVIDGGAGNDIIYGQEGNDVITGGLGNDTISGGSGNDTIAGGDGVDTLTGGTGNDTYSYGSTAEVAGDAIAEATNGGIDTLRTTGSAVDLSSLNGGADLEGAGADQGIEQIVIQAGGTATLTGTQLSGNTIAINESANSGTTNLVINVAAGATNSFANLTFASAGGDAFDNGADTITINGAAGNESITATSLGATINAGAGSDTIAINAGTSAAAWSVDLGNDAEPDKVIFQHAAANASQNTLVTVSNFKANDRFAVVVGGSEEADGTYLEVTSTSVTNVTGGSAPEVIELRHSSFVPLSLADDVGTGPGTIKSFLASLIDNITAGTYTVIAYSGNSGTVDAGVYTMTVPTVSGSGNLTAGQITLEHIATIKDVAYGSLADANFVASTGIDPLILDLGDQGITFTGLDDGVSFDINADGAVDQVAWTTGQDGILALDVNGNGTIDSGAEIFSPYFAGGDHASSLAALASLDSNGDGVMDANDAQFANLTVWQDLNHDGVSQANELSDLAANGITSVDLQATPTDTTINGQQVVSEGTFTAADGANGTFVEVAFDTSLASNAANEPHTFVLDNANETASIADYSAARGDVIDVSGLLEAHFGENSQVSDFVNVIENGSDVTIQIDQNGPASGAHFVDVAVLHGYGTSASDIVRIAFENVEQQIAV